MLAQETAAISVIRTLQTAEVQYYSQYGRYAASLAELGPPASGASAAAGADLIAGDLAAGAKQGYRFTVTGSRDGYVITAVPEVYNSTGSRAFYSDQSMIIHQNHGREPATAGSPPIE